MISKVFLLFGVHILRLVSAGFDCPHPNGYYPDPDDCKIYFRCIDGGWDRHSCGPGTVFNPSHSICDYPNRVPGCEHETSEIPDRPPQTTETYPTPQYPTTTKSYPSSRYPTTRYETTRKRTTRYKPTEYPPTRQPPTRQPPTRYPPTEHPPTRYRPTTSRYTPPRATTPPRDYGKFDCKRDGFFGHPKYCDHFYRCVMTRPILFECAPGTYFDDIIGTCNYKEQVTECDDNGIKHERPRPTYRPSRQPTKPPGGRPSRQPPTDWPSQEPSHWTSAMPSWSPAFSDYFTSTTSFPTTSAEIFICPNRCGFYPHPTRCDQFVVCMDFEANVHDCPPELYFNWQAKTCDYKQNVNCYISNFENVYKKK